MQPRVLGVVSASNGGEAIAFGSPTQRTMLAVLACRANRPITAEALADEVWCGRPPVSWRSNLQTGSARSGRRARRNWGARGRV